LLDEDDGGLVRALDGPMAARASGMIYMNRMYSPDLFRLGLHRSKQVPAMLQRQPEAGAGSEELGQTKRGTWSRSALAVYQLVDALIRHVDSVSEVSLGDPHGLQELLQEHFSGMSRLSVCRYTNHDFLVLE
jgi:hypothetical protein